VRACVHRICCTRIIIIVLFDGETDGGVCELFRNVCENHQECVGFPGRRLKSGLFPFVGYSALPTTNRIYIYTNNDGYNCVYIYEYTCILQTNPTTIKLFYSVYYNNKINYLRIFILTSRPTHFCSCV
jgi:hypothetical protein